MSPKRITAFRQAQRAYEKSYRNWLLHQPKTAVIAAPMGTQDNKLIHAGQITEGPHRNTVESVKLSPEQIELYNRFNPRAPIACTIG